MSYHHKPVLLEASLEVLKPKKGGLYIDLTFGGGGHTKAILDAEKDIKVLAFDQDPITRANTENLPKDRFTFIPANFRYLERYLKIYKTEQIDGILADLGVSSHHLDEASRGFSFQKNATLDMRMNTLHIRKAKDVIAEASESELADIFYFYGELRNAKQLAKAIVHKRKTCSIETSFDFVKTVEQYIPKYDKRNKILAQMFQALRIEVNEELKALEEMLSQSSKLIKKDGRLVIISYHSLEDRLVKYFLRSGNTSDKKEQDVYGNTLRPFTPLQSKAFIPSELEQQQNPRSRSAKMRVGVKN